MKPTQILFMGGAGEVGLNATLYQQGDEAVLLDFGAYLGDPRPSINRVVPDPGPLFRNARRLHGVVLTHGHEDHLGAIAYLMRSLRVPVYGAPFGLELTRSRLNEAGFHQPDLRAVDPGKPFRLGPFEVELLSVTHSIPDACMVSLKTDQARFLHTGDFKLDSDPVGQTTDLERLRTLGAAGVDVLLSDSTNAERSGRTISERAVLDALEDEIRRARGKVVVTLFASHVHRISGLFEIARRTGRRVCLLGLSMVKNVEAGRKLGFLPRDLEVIPSEVANRLPSDRVLCLATGTQGEPQGALARIGRSSSPVFIETGDTVILSCRTIPGRELAVRAILNQLVGRGIHVRSPRERPELHTSGHAEAQEHRELLDLVSPQYLVPFHGDRVMMEAHAETARRWGMPAERILIPEDGAIFEWTEGRLTRAGKEDVPSIPIGGTGPLNWSVVGARERMGRSGALAVLVHLDASSRPSRDPWVQSLGFHLEPSERAALIDALRRDLDDALFIDRDQMLEIILRSLQHSLGLRRSELPWVQADWHFDEPHADSRSLHTRS
ncbi:MAG: ribonuclease J [Myxococcota bacterium]